MIKTDRSAKTNKLLIIGSVIAAFVCMFIFFYSAHPIVILDADDWQYVSYSRLPVPYTAYWNPSRILPEVLMNLCGSMALQVYRLGSLGYIESQILVFAVAVSLFIALYVAAFIVLIRKKSGISTLASCGLGALFLVLHFIIFRKTAENNLYMFYSYDMCCYFYYTVSALVNCTLLMYFEYSGILDDFFTRKRIPLKILLVIVTYFAVFSNLFNSIILVAYLGVRFLAAFFRALREKRNIGSLLKGYAAPLAVIVLWLVAVYCEGHGGRAGNGWDKSVFLTNVLAAGRHVLETFAGFSIPFYLLMVLAAAGLLFVIVRKKDTAEERREFCSFVHLQLAAAFVIILFLALLCARVNVGYILRPQVMFGFIYSLFMIICITAAYVIKHCKAAGYILPVILAAGLILCNTKGTTYAASNPLGISEQVCISVDNDLINQMVEADLSGTEKTYIYVMDTGVDDNWPHTAFIGYGLKQTLLKHGIIHRDFGIIPEMSREFNERNGIDIQFFWPRQYRAFYPTLF